MGFRGSLSDAVAMNVLGALLNASVEEEPRRVLHEQGAAERFTPFLDKSRPGIMARVAGLLARVVQHGTAAAALRGEQGAIEALLEGAMGKVDGETQAATVRCLAAMCTKDAGTIKALA